jgi:ADP-heptose:LPS heptosyltransferase
VADRAVLTGSAAEAERCACIARGAALPPDADLAATTDVVGLARLVASAGRVVCGDTGVGHLATAFGRPSVLLFGPTSPAAWGPPPGRSQHRVLWAGTVGDPAADVVDAGLARITPAQVVDALGAS